MLTSVEHHLGHNISFRVIVVLCRLSHVCHACPCKHDVVGIS